MLSGIHASVATGMGLVPRMGRASRWDSKSQTSPTQMSQTKRDGARSLGLLGSAADTSELDFKLASHAKLQANLRSRLHTWVPE